MTCAPGVHAHLQNGASSEGLGGAEKGWREASLTPQSCQAPTPAGHSPLRSLTSSPSLAPPSSAGPLAASAASPTLKLPFRPRMTGDLVGIKARRRSHDGGQRGIMLTPISSAKPDPRAHAQPYQLLVGTWGSKS